MNLRKFVLLPALFSLLAFISPSANAEAPRSTIVVDEFMALCVDGGDFDQLNSKASNLGWGAAKEEYAPLFFSDVLKQPDRIAHLSKDKGNRYKVFALIGEEQAASLIIKRMKSLCAVRIIVEDPEPSRVDLRHRIGADPDKVRDDQTYSADVWTNWLSLSVVILQIHRTNDGYAVVTINQFTGDA